MVVSGAALQVNVLNSLRIADYIACSRKNLLKFGRKNQVVPDPDFEVQNLDDIEVLMRRLLCLLTLLNSGWNMGQNWYYM